MLLFVMPYCNEYEREKFQLIVDNWDRIVEMRSPFRILFVKTIDTRVATGLEHSFLDYRDPDGLPDSWALRVSTEWAQVARHIEDSVDCKYWFWWEHDALPVRQDCFEFFLRLWSGDRCRIMGYKVKDNECGMRNKINGVAIYSKHYWSYIKPYFNLNGGFDNNKVFCSKAEKDAFVELNKWYSLVQHEGRLLLTPNLRLVHGIKDHSLVNHVLGKGGAYPVVSDSYRAMRNALTVSYLNSREKYYGLRCRMEKLFVRR